MLSCYARHVAQNFPSEDNPEATVEGVKIYRVIHSILLPAQMEAGFQPDDPTTYNMYFEGEFDRDGKLKNPQDPFLYWLIPILREPKPGFAPNPFRDHEEGKKPNLDNFEVKDYSKVHAAISAKEIAEFVAKFQ
jgi:hypothetical protein